MLTKKTLLSLISICWLGFMSYTYADADKRQLKIEIDEETHYVVHYNAFSSEILSRNSAKSYKVTRSKNRALLNVVVRKGGKESLMHTTAVLAKVTAQITNLNNQQTTLDMRQIQDGDAIYYIDDFRVSDEETLKFTITVDPEYQDKEYEITFSQQFFTD